MQDHPDRPARAGAGAMPWPAAPAGEDPEAEAAAWRAAQGRLAARLAEVAALLGRLDMRLAADAGARRRIVLREVDMLGWQLGPRLPGRTVALALEGAMPTPRRSEDAQRLRTLVWAARRLDGPPPPLGDGEALARWLGWGTPPRRGQAAGLDAVLPPPDRLQDLAAWDAALAGFAALHPILRAAVAALLWRRAGLADSAPVEGAVLAAMLGPGDGFRALRALPRGQSRPTAARTPDDRAAAWLDDVERSALAHMLEMDRLADWRARVAAAGLPRACRATAAVLADRPLASAVAIAADTGLSRSGTVAALRRLEAAGLARETTGQARFRFWSAAV